jgi:hypothetical protein
MPAIAPAIIWMMRIILGVVVFVASYAILTIHVAPMLTQEGGRRPLDEAQVARFPVAIVLRQESASSKTGLAVVQMRDLESETAKAADYSFLLPLGQHDFVDQDGEPASYTAENVSPGHQKIFLRANAWNDYTNYAEYEAEERQVFPVRQGYTGAKLGVYTIPLSAFLAWLVLWLTRGRQAKAQQLSAGDGRV